MDAEEIKDFLDRKVLQYNTPNFIASDPIQIPHLFTLKEDIEIAGFLTATIAWGNRKMIINSATKLMEAIGNSPYDFVMHHNEKQLKNLDAFVHRTFNAEDAQFFIRSLKHMYQNHAGLEAVFTKNTTPSSTQGAISAFKKHFFEINPTIRTTKHVSDPLNGSAAKRINMFNRVISVVN